MSISIAPLSFQRMCAHFVAVVFAVVLTGALASPADAATIAVVRKFRVASVDPVLTALAVGDQFRVRFVINDVTVDSNGGGDFGFFSGLVSTVSFTGAGSNIGTWAPTGTFDLFASVFSTSDPSDYVFLQFFGGGFPDGGPGYDFEALALLYHWPGGIEDSGGGETFSSHLQGIPFDIPPATEWEYTLRFFSESGPPDFRYVVLTDVTLFTDGFESGGIARWSP